MGKQIKRKEVNGAGRIRSEKLREHQYIEGYVSKSKQMQERVNCAMVDSAKENAWGWGREESKEYMIE